MLSCYNDGTRDRYQSLVNFDARCTCCSAAVLYTLKEHYVYGACVGKSTRAEISALVLQETNGKFCPLPTHFLVEKHEIVLLLLTHRGTLVMYATLDLIYFDLFC